MFDYDVVKEVAEEISTEADKQFLSSVIMTLRQHIESRLKVGGDAYLKFNERVKKLFGENPGDISHKAYIEVVCVEMNDNNNMKHFARVFPKIDRVRGLNNGINNSYALHIKIATSGGASSYDKSGFITKNSRRFAVGHDIGDVFLNLDFLIDNAIADESEADEVDVPKHYRSDFFSYILSDLRDFSLLGLGKQFNIESALEEYQQKIGGEIEECLRKEAFSEESFEEEKNRRYEEFKSVFEETKKLHENSWYSRKSMAYSVFALREVIRRRINSAIDLKIEQLKKEINKHENDNETNELINNWEKLDEQKSRVSIHLINRENITNDEPTLDCYVREDCGTRKKLYCFEICVSQFPEDGIEESVCKVICRMMGCIYWGCDSIINRINNTQSQYVGTFSRTINEFDLESEQIDTFADMLYNLRNKVFLDKIQKLGQEEMLFDRLRNYKKIEPV